MEPEESIQRNGVFNVVVKKATIEAVCKHADLARRTN